MTHLSRRSRHLPSTLSVLATLTVASIAHAEAPYTQSWARQIGTSSDDYGYKVTNDASGNLFITGYTLGSLAGPQVGAEDLYLAKYNPAGTLLWKTQLGSTTTPDDGLGVATDSAGNSFVTGYTRGNIGAPNAGIPPTGDAFLIKYDPAGNIVWKRQFGGTQDDVGREVRTDAAGNVYVTGQTASFFAPTRAGGFDAVIVKYDNAGNQLWKIQTGSSDNDFGYGIAIDGASNLYITGDTFGSYAGPNPGSYDPFLAKYDSSGNQIWKRQFGTSADDEADSVATDSSGNIFIVGLTRGALAGPNAGSADMYLAKYDSAGNQLWKTQFGTSGDDQGWGLSTDNAGNAYITGFSTGSLGAPNAGGKDIVLAKYDPTGTQVWKTQFGTSADDVAYSVSNDSSGNVFIGGYTNGSPAAANAGGSDVYFAKYSPAPEPASLSLLALGSLTLPLAPPETNLIIASFPFEPSQLRGSRRSPSSVLRMRCGKFRSRHRPASLDYMQVTVPDGYAGWSAADLINEYVDTHGGAWPRGWADLRETRAKWTQKQFVAMEEVEARVEVNWNVDSKAVAAGAEGVRLVWLKDGRHVWFAVNPEEVIRKHLRERREKGAGTRD